MPAQRLSAADRLEKFLEDAKALIHEQGLEALTMERLAEYSGVNKAVAYRFFNNRDDVLVALYQRSCDLYDAMLAEERRAPQTFRDEAEALINTWVASMKQEFGIPALETARTASGELEQLRAERHATSAKFIADLIRAHYKITPRRAKMAAAIIYSSTQGFLHSYQAPHANQKELVTTYINMIVGAVEAAC